MLPLPSGGGVEYGFANTQNVFVDVTLPGGRVEKFIMGYVGVRTRSGQGAPLSRTTLFFVPRDSRTKSKLEPLNENDELNAEVTVSPGQLGPVQFIDKFTGQVWNPTRWRLTAADGTVFVIDEGEGVKTITDLNGNMLTFEGDQIAHSSGQTVTIQRDGLNRVTSITDPEGKGVEYDYDAYGDLVSVTDREGNVTRSTYDALHTLEEVHDPLGRHGRVRNTMRRVGWSALSTRKATRSILATRSQNESNVWSMCMAI